MERSQAAAYKGQAQATLGNERGMALILALVMLVLMTLLGTWVLDTSSTDLKISGNSRNATKAFYAADSAMSLMKDPTILHTVTRENPIVHPVLPPPTPEMSGTTMTGTIRLIGDGLLPQGAIYDAEQFVGQYYIVTGVGSGPNNATAVVEAGVITVAPKYY